MKNSGFTLIEILIATAVVSVIFTSLASIVTVSLRNTSINTRKIIATHMADELQEWLRGEKERDWTNFVGNSNTTGNTICFNTEPIVDWGTANACPIEYQYDVNNKFNYKRYVTLKKNGDIVESRVEVVWSEGVKENSTDMIYTVQNNTYYTQW